MTTRRWKFSALVEKLSIKVRATLGQRKKPPEHSLSDEERQRLAEIRGEESEAKVLKLCVDMAIWNELPPRPKGALPWRTEKYSTLDLDGVDIVVPTDLGDVYIQVKSSAIYFLKFVKKPGTKHIVCVNGTWEENYLHKRLKENISSKYRRLQRLATS